MNGAQSKKTSPWVYVAAGCGCLVLLAVVVVVGLGWWGAQKAKEFGEGFADPEKRLAKVQEALGAEELPPGYQNGFAISVPFVMEMAMLGDAAPDAPTEPGQVEIDEDDLFDRRGFIYMKIRNFGEESQTDSTLEDLNDDFRSEEELGTGTIEAAGGTVSYVLSRGTLNRNGDALDTYMAQLQIDCPGDDTVRHASWFAGVPGTGGGLQDDGMEPTGEPMEPAGEVDPMATDEAMIDETAPPEEAMAAPEVAPEPSEPSPGAGYLMPRSEAELAEFLAYFDLCR